MFRWVAGQWHLKRATECRCREDASLRLPAGPEIVSRARMLSTVMIPAPREVLSTVESRIVETCERWGVDRSLYQLPSEYDPQAQRVVAGERLCSGCWAQIPVFWWRNREDEDSRPPRPYPTTIIEIAGQYRCICPKCRGSSFTQLYFAE